MLNIVVPMAGRGSRFAEAGFNLPKPLIPVLPGLPMIQVVINNLSTNIPHQFIFLCLQEHIDTYKIDTLLAQWAPGCQVVPVTTVTEGAACTVLLAKHLINNDNPLMIANSDQWVATNINEYLDVLYREGADGLIMTMKADNPAYSYVKFDGMGNVADVVEKHVVSDEATVGIYNFRHGRDFVCAAESMIAWNIRTNNEFYIAPVYSELIKHGGKVALCNVGDEHSAMHSMGVPAELARFQSYLSLA